MYCEDTREPATKVTMTIEVTDAEAFRILCKALDMDFITDDDFDYYPKRFNEPDYDGCIVCYRDDDGDERVIDDRGDLFVALCNLCVNMFPNVKFRGADWIYRYGEKE